MEDKHTTGTPTQAALIGAARPINSTTTERNSSAYPCPTDPRAPAACSVPPTSPAVHPPTASPAKSEVGGCPLGEATGATPLSSMGTILPVPRDLDPRLPRRIQVEHDFLYAQRVLGARKDGASSRTEISTVAAMHICYGRIYALLHETGDLSQNERLPHLRAALLALCRRLPVRLSIYEPDGLVARARRLFHGVIDALDQQSVPIDRYQTRVRVVVREDRRQAVTEMVDGVADGRHETLLPPKASITTYGDQHLVYGFRMMAAMIQSLLR
jgi:hypothetical protein